MTLFDLDSFVTINAAKQKEMKSNPDVMMLVFYGLVELIDYIIDR